MYNWRFPILDGGKKQGINDSGIATFAGSELYNNLAREICQNSLDAKDPDVQGPVQVQFSFKSIYKKAFKPVLGLDEILDSCKSYWEGMSDKKLNAFLNDAYNAISQDNIDILQISDFNTIGLCGSEDKSGAWDALTGSNGVSYKSNGSQGSFGIGKNAPYACSYLRTVFYNTYSKLDEKKAFQGVTSLVTHLNKSGRETQGCGFYYNVDTQKPIFNIDQDDQLKIFSRKDFGTDIIILAFKKEPNCIVNIISAIIKNFFISILQYKLVVRVEGELIDKKNLFTLLYKEPYISDKNLDRVRNYCETYTTPTKVYKGSILEHNDVELYVKINEKYDKNISYFRSSGMLIKEKKEKKMKPYQAILFVNDGKLNELLKLTEPPKHNKWDYTLLDENRHEGRINIEKLNGFVKDSLEQLCKSEDLEEIDPDGLSDFLPDDLSDLMNGNNAKKQDEGNSEDVISDVKKLQNDMDNTTIVGSKKDDQKPTDGEVHNEESGGDSTEHTPPSIVEPGGQEGIVPDINGDKKLTLINVKFARLIPVNYSKGMYNLICSFENDYDNINLSFDITGEDNNYEHIFIYDYLLKDEKVVVNSQSLQLENIKKEEVYNIKIHLNTVNKVVISIGGYGHEVEKQ